MGSPRYIHGVSIKLIVIQSELTVLNIKRLYNVHVFGVILKTRNCRDMKILFSTAVIINSSHK